jgi:predicted GIY-YIG superfamily endonuclease
MQGSSSLRAYKAPDLKNRLHQHGNPPLLYKEHFQNKHQAAPGERQIKGFSNAKKQELIKGPNK